MLIAALLLALPAPVAPAQDAQPGAEVAAAAAALALPLTIEKVWYRAGEKKSLGGMRAFKANGDLTLTPEGLEFHGGKDSFSIPVANITMVSLGKLGRDVDTDWAVIGLREGGLARVIAFRDGKALGYGQDTSEIYRKIRSAMEELGGAQFNVPPGYRPYDAIDDQVALMVPDGWSVHTPSAINIDGRSPWGTHLFSSKPLAGGHELNDGEAIRQRVTDEATREFFLVREQALAGMSCSGFKPRALAELLQRTTQDPLFASEFQLQEPPRSTPVTIAGCEGLRVLARGRRADGLAVVLDLRLVAHHDTLFTFGVRALASAHDDLLKTLEPVVAAARFATAIR